MSSRRRANAECRYGIGIVGETCGLPPGEHSSPLRGGWFAGRLYDGGRTQFAPTRIARRELDKTILSSERPQAFPCQGRGTAHGVPRNEQSRVLGVHAQRWMSSRRFKNKQYTPNRCKTVCWGLFSFIFCFSLFRFQRVRGSICRLPSLTRRDRDLQATFPYTTALSACSVMMISTCISTPSRVISITTVSPTRAASMVSTML